jgi:reactive intermediate/imine deaminase
MTTLQHCNSGKILHKDLPFSEAVKVGNLLFLSGALGAKPHTLEVVPGGIVAETHQMMDNIRTVLEENNTSLSNLIRCTVMMADMQEWQKFNEVYVTYFNKPYPARSAFGASELALGARVEMECIALVE